MEDQRHEVALERFERSLQAITILLRIMKRIITGISDSCKLTNAMFTPEQTSFNANSAIANIVQMMSRKAKMVGTSVLFRKSDEQNGEIDSLKWDSTIPQQLIGDEVRMQ